MTTTTTTTTKRNITDLKYNESLAFLTLLVCYQVKKDVLIEMRMWARHS